MATASLVGLLCPAACAPPTTVVVDDGPWWPAAGEWRAIAVGDRWSGVWSNNNLARDLVLEPIAGIVIELRVITHGGGREVLVLDEPDEMAKGTCLLPSGVTPRDVSIRVVGQSAVQIRWRWVEDEVLPPGASHP